MSATTAPRAVTHIGITVTDIDAAIKWYEDVMGFRLIGEPGEVDLNDGSHFAQVCTDIFGADSGTNKLRLAHLSTANGTALELFEYVDPPTEVPENNFVYRQAGINHFCVTDPDVAGLARRIEETGGKQRSKVWSLFPGQPYEICYCEDPFGTIVEIYSHSHEHMFANQG
jgi:catechol 2,3-dioxygenase-like lactoylglutathione lyase family enzyme